MAFQDADPDVPERLSISTALLMHLVAAALGDPKMPTPKIGDFLYDPWDPVLFQDPEKRKKAQAKTALSLLSQIPGVTITRPEGSGK